MDTQSWSEVDDRCMECESPLPKNPKPGTPAYNGFCSTSCRNTYTWEQRQGKKRHIEDE